MDFKNLPNDDDEASKLSNSEPDLSFLEEEDFEELRLKRLLLEQDLEALKMEAEELQEKIKVIEATIEAIDEKIG